MDRAAERPSAPGWWLDELGHAGRENLDPSHVDRYDHKMDAAAPSEVELLRSVGLRSSSVVVDLGCGTGQFVMAVAPFVRRVVAVDVSPVMRDHLSRKLASAGYDNVDVVAAGFVSYEHIGDRPDVVYSRYALHHLPDFWKVIALRRVRSLLAPNGVFRLWDIAYDFEPDETAARVESWCSPFGDTVDGDWARWELEEHVRDEHSTYTWLLEAMFARTGLVIDRAEHSDDGFDARYLLRPAPDR